MRDGERKMKKLMVILVVILMSIQTSSFGSNPDIVITDVIGGSEELVNFKKVDELESISFKVTSTSDSIPNARNLPVGATYSNDGVFSWTPSDTQSGMYALGFYLGDPNNLIYKNIRIVVANTYFRIPYDEEFQYLFMATDPDNDDVELTITYLPEGATFEGGKFTPKLFSWKPTEEQIGVHTMTLVATDNPSGGSPKQDVSVITLNVTRLKYESMPYDFNRDGKVNLLDYAMFSKHWMKGIKPTPVVPVDKTKIIVYYDIDGTDYHKPDCQSLSTIMNPEETSAAIAETAGKVPHTICKPLDVNYTNYPKFDRSVRDLQNEFEGMEPMEIFRIMLERANDPNSQ